MCYMYGIHWLEMPNGSNLRGKVKLGEAGLTKDFKNMHLMYIM